MVVKQIHHEPCDYYQFGNKIEAEICDYGRLHKIGIAMPEMLPGTGKKDVRPALSGQYKH